VPPAARLSRRGALASGFAVLAGCVTGSTGGGDARTPDSPDARLGFVGDVMLGRGVNQRHRDGPPAAVWGDLTPVLEDLDGVFANLECSLSTRGERTPNRGYYFRADPAWAIPALEAANVAWVGLANNHVLDFGELALTDTVEALRGAAIPTSGAGETRSAAFAPANVDVGGLDVAVLAVTDRAPAYAAGAVQPGTAYVPMVGDPLTRYALSAAIEEARSAGPDLLVVSLHWGPNWVTVPAERYRRLAHWLVEAGADVVHGHSAHVPQGIEVYRGRPILHDCGDFVDDYALVGDLHNDRSVWFDLAVSNGRPTTLRLHPVEIEAAAVHRSGGDAADWVRQAMRTRSAAFGTDLRREGDALACDLRR